MVTQLCRVSLNDMHMFFFNFSTFKGVQLFYVVRFTENVPLQEYDVAPLSWMVSNDVVEFPLYERTKLEKMVFELQPRQPKRDFKRYPVTIIHWTGKLRQTLNTVQRAFLNLQLVFHSRRLRPRQRRHMATDGY